MHLYRSLQVEGPVRPLTVVVLDKLAENRPEMLLVQDDELVQAFSS